MQFLHPLHPFTELNFQWRLSNNGSLEAIGYKCDTVYLSDDDEWDITDYQFGDPQCSRVTIQPYEGDMRNEESFSLTSNTPFLAQRNYTGIVRTRSNIRDLNLENNIGYADTLLRVSAPTLDLGTLTIITLTPGEELVYRIENIPRESTLIATLTVTNDDAPYHDLLLRHGNPPTGYEHDANSQYALSSNQKAVVRSTKSGTYYLSIENSGTGEEGYEVEVLVKIAVFEILSISPIRAAPLGNVTILISGTLFGNNLQASLLNDTDPDITYTALALYWFNSEDVYATFNASALSTGTYSVHLVDTITNAMTRLNNSFQIAEGIPGQLSVVVRPPRPLRPDTVGTLELYVRNSGNTDILTPLLTLQSQGNALFQIVGERSSGSASQISFFPITSNGPGGILPPGVGVQLFLDVTPRDSFTGRERLQVFYVEDEAEPHTYLDQRDTLKPSSIPDEVWDIIWSNFQDSVGSSWATFIRRMSEVATEFSLVQKKVYSLEELVDYQLRIAYGLLTGKPVYTWYNYIKLY